MLKIQAISRNISQDISSTRSLMLLNTCTRLVMHTETSSQTTFSQMINSMLRQQTLALLALQLAELELDFLQLNQVLFPTKHLKSMRRNLTVVNKQIFSQLPQYCSSLQPVLHLSQLQIRTNFTISSSQTRSGRCSGSITSEASQLAQVSSAQSSWT